MDEPGRLFPALLPTANPTVLYPRQEATTLPQLRQQHRLQEEVFQPTRSTLADSPRPPPPPRPNPRIDLLPPPPRVDIDISLLLSSIQPSAAISRTSVLPSPPISIARQHLLRPRSTLQIPTLLLPPRLTEALSRQTRLSLILSKVRTVRCGRTFPSRSRRAFMEDDRSTRRRQEEREVRRRASSRDGWDPILSEVRVVWESTATEEETKVLRRRRRVRHLVLDPFRLR